MEAQRPKKTVLALALFALLLGVGCLNYTKAFGFELHVERAESLGIPAPSPAIWYAGVLLVALGGGAVGSWIARARAAR